MDREAEMSRALFFASTRCGVVFILRHSPCAFTLLNLTLVFPLSLLILGHALVASPIFLHFQLLSSSTYTELALLFLYQFAYLLLFFLFTFSLISFFLVVFMVGSCSSAPITFKSTLFSISLIVPCIFKTLLSVSTIMLLHYTTFFLSIRNLLMLIPPNHYPHTFAFTLIIVCILFLISYIYISAVWHLASAVSMLESVFDFPGIKRSHDLLRGLMKMTADFVIRCLLAIVVIGEAFKAVVVKGHEDEGAFGIGLGPGILIGVAIVRILVMMNLVGLVIQSIYNYVCRIDRREDIDNSVV